MRAVPLLLGITVLFFCSVYSNTINELYAGVTDNVFVEIVYDEGFLVHKRGSRIDRWFLFVNDSLFLKGHNLTIGQNIYLKGVYGFVMLIDGYGNMLFYGWID